MWVSPYAGPFGRLKSALPDFLSAGAIRELLGTKDVHELAFLLETTPYGAAIKRTRATHSGAPLVEIALNRTLVQRNHFALDQTPFEGRPVVAAYLARWDLQNIALILSSKAWGRTVTATEDHLVSAREAPAGFYTGPMGIDDFRILLAQPTLEATVTTLMNYGYGASVLPLLAEFERTHNVFPILSALRKEYYRNALHSTRLLRGSEWVLHEFLESEVDVQNILLLLEGKSVDLPFEEVLPHWIEGGRLLPSEASEHYAAQSVRGLAEEFAPRWPSIQEVARREGAGDSLTGYQTALQYDRARLALNRFATYPLSLGIVFGYLLRAELEWRDLLRILFARVYGLSSAEVRSSLVAYRLAGGTY